MKYKSIVVAPFLALLLPVTAWAMVKPLRVVAPELLGLFCTTDNICIDDPTRLKEARHLLTTSISFVEQELGQFQSIPKAVFCTTRKCASKFGLDQSVAFDVGSSGVIFSERAWHPHFVRHELIHHLQNERLGTLNVWLHKPSWLIEGMAYSRSRDPRQPLPEPLQSWRNQYEQWEQQDLSANLWERAEAVQPE
ncbi:MAG: hypothetical protein VXW65_01065 [Pseudomonadota bacterium]|nr:hypothetical protein [Pseudomonadota bacterium]